MPAIGDLKPEQLSDLYEIQDLLKSKWGHVSPFDQSEIVGLLKNYEARFAIRAVYHCCANNWRRAPQWKQLAELIDKYGIEKVDFAIERLNGRENYSIDSVAGILKGEIPAMRKPIVNPKQATQEAVAAQKRNRVEYPTPEGIYDRSAASFWLRQRDHVLDRVYEFFEIASHENGNVLLKLKAEYR